MVLPGSSIGRYQVKRKLAEGGMAELYLCTAIGPEGFEKEVVIKRIKAFLSGDPSFIEMFKAEARLASRLNHANVVQIFDFDKHDDAWFIAMEYVYGASLWELRRRCRELAMPFPPVLVAEIGAQVARGLHYAHTLSDKGKPLALVHRDVTPHNVLMSFDGGVKLTDFGIAKAGTSFTAPGMLKGKFAYMSPEQARGEKVDLRTDVFALGITLWEMLTGGRLFEGDSEMAVLRAVQESLIAPPSRMNPDVPVELSDIVMKALSRPLEQRYQTAHELDRALAGFVLKNSASPEDSNVGLFLRQMFRDELEAAERELSSPSLPSDPGKEPSRTPVVDAYALGNTKQVNRQHDPPTQQTATPLPSAPPPAPAGPVLAKTAEMPGQRRSRPLPPLMDDDGPPAQRTEQMNELAGQPREGTAPQPGLRPSRKLVPLPDLAPALNVPETAKTEPRGMDATVPGRAPVLQQAPSNEVTTPVADDGRRRVLPWILGAALVAGLVAGVAFTRGGSPAVVEIPIVVPPPPPTPVVAAPVEPEPEPAPAVAEPVAVAPVEAPAPAPAPAPKDDAAPAVKPVAAAAKGTLTIDAVPYGLLFINNAKVSEVSGKRTFPLAPGTYAIRLSHTRLEMNESVVIKSGKNVTLTFRPQVAPAQ